MIAPGTTLNAADVTLVLNQQIPLTGPDAGLTVNAVAVTVNAGAQLNAVLGSSESDIGNRTPRYFVSTGRSLDPLTGPGLPPTATKTKSAIRRFG